MLNHRTGRAWVLRTLDCSLVDLRDAGRTAGGSVDDAYLAALLGGLRRYHEHHGTPVGDLPVPMPDSLRRADDPLGGNEFAGAVFGAPAGVEDPAERIAVIRGLVLSVVTEPALDTISVLAPVVSRLPAVVGATIMEHGGARTDLAASNVPGIREKVFLAGARIDRCIPLRPAPRRRRHGRHDVPRRELQHRPHHRRHRSRRCRRAGTVLP
ncbi:WS/DGAT domain-containing protein [Geodermatophilus sp. SYSU D00710]